jgi:flagellar basal body L-ring protein FlgH
VKSDIEKYGLNGEDHGFFTGGRSIWLAVIAASILVAFSSCSQIMGGLRPDLDDEYRYEREPTAGGRFSEGGLLDDDRGRGPDSDSMAHNERRPGSPGRMGGQGSWLQEGEDERNALRRPTPSESDDETPPLAARPQMLKKFKNGMRATRDDFIDDSRSDGSLWNSDGQTNYFLTKNRTKSEGDLVTVVSEEEFLRDVAAEIKRTLSPDERESEMDLAQERMRRKAMGLPEDPNAAEGDKVANSQASADRNPASAAGDEKKFVQVPNVTWAEIDLRKSIEMKAGDPVMMEVLERYPNGNYKLRGLKRVRYQGRTKMVSVVAIAKSSDISDDETITSGKLYEYRIESVR